MRWNPRRRQVTSVVYVHSTKKDEKPKSPWNSLEIAKIAVGTLTPLAIAFFGFYVTHQTHTEDVERMQREELRARKAAAAPLIDELMANTVGILSAIDDAAKLLATQKAPEMKVTLERLHAFVKERQGLVSQADAKLQYLIDDPAVTASLSGAWLQQDIEIASALECADTQLNPSKGKACSITEHTNNLWHCGIARNFVLQSFDHLPITLGGIDVSNCDLGSTVKQMSPAEIKQAHAYRPIPADSAASH